MRKEFKTKLKGDESRAALAHLQLGRAYVLAGDKDKARIAYEDFFKP